MKLCLSLGLNSSFLYLCCSCALSMLETEGGSLRRVVSQTFTQHSRNIQLTYVTGNVFISFSSFHSEGFCVRCKTSVCSLSADEDFFQKVLWCVWSSTLAACCWFLVMFWFKYWSQWNVGWLWQFIFTLKEVAQFDWSMQFKLKNQLSRSSFEATHKKSQRYSGHDKFKHQNYFHWWNPCDTVKSKKVSGPRVKMVSQHHKT